MPFVTSPNMSLQIPTVGTQPNPDASLNVNTSLTLIDAHDHTPGSGVQLTPDALNINADLDMQENNLLSVRSVRFEPQVSPISNPADLDCLYVSGVDLYYNDGSGNQVRITQGGSVTGATGTITGLVAPASASYNSFSETFVWQSNANKPANMDMGSIIIREPVTNGFGVEIEASASIGADYTLTLPAALPADSALITVNSSGVMGYGPAAPASNSLLAMDETGVVTATVYDQFAQTGVITFSTSSTTFVPVTGMEVTVTSRNGRPIRVELVPGNNTNQSRLSVTDSTSRIIIEVNDDPSTDRYFFIPVGTSPTGGVGFTDTSPVGAPGAYKYTVYAAASGSGAIGLTEIRLLAYEV